MKLCNMGPIDLMYRYKNKVKRLPYGANHDLPSKAKHLVFWYDEFQKHKIDLDNIRTSNLLSGIDSIVLMDSLKIEIPNSLTGYYYSPRRFEWCYISPYGMASPIVGPTFEIEEERVYTSDAKKIDRNKYNKSLDKMTNESYANYYWIILFILFLVVAAIGAISLFVFG